MLADGGITVVWVGGILLLGFLGFFVMLIAALGRCIGFVLRLLVGNARRVDAAGPSSVSGAGRPCGHPRCGHLNPADARYCARCGSALGPPDDVDRYG